jgi:hypothetical protein
MRTKSLTLSCLIILLVAAVIFFVVSFIDRPYKVLSPKSYPSGTISLYKDIPSGFPKEVVLEQGTPNSSSKVTSPDIRTQNTVTYISVKQVAELAKEYEANFIANGWIIKSKTSGKVPTFFVIKGDHQLILTISALSPTETMLTFQYEK